MLLVDEDAIFVVVFYELDFFLSSKTLQETFAS